ncbi:MAG: hypothetical protein ACP5JW_05800 [Candidatus Bathyarchaeia archaeon]
MEEKDDKPRRFEEKNLPWFYRLILKVPGTDFLESAGGIFWGILIPIFLIGEFFLSLYLLMTFPFPVNIILTFIIPAVTFTFFVKVSLRRFINWWNATFGESGFKWDVEKAVEEYVNLLKRRKGKYE